jgi:hypothetical protein
LEFACRQSPQIHFEVSSGRHGRWDGFRQVFHIYLRAGIPGASATAYAIVSMWPYDE